MEIIIVKILIKLKYPRLSSKLKNKKKNEMNIGHKNLLEKYEKSPFEKLVPSIKNTKASGANGGISQFVK